MIEEEFTLMESPAMSAEQRGLLFAMIRLCCPAIAIHEFHHARSLTAADKQALLPAPLMVQKSLSLALGDQLILVSGLGDFQIDRTFLRGLTRILGLPLRAAKQAQINPARLEPLRATGLAQGMVSPFFPPSHGAVLPFVAVVLLPAPVPLFADTQTAISLSLQSSVLVPSMLLDRLIYHYAWRVYPHIPVISWSAGEGLREEHPLERALQLATVGGRD